MILIPGEDDFILNELSYFSQMDFYKKDARSILENLIGDLTTKLGYLENEIFRLDLNWYSKITISRY